MVQPLLEGGFFFYEAMLHAVCMGQICIFSCLACIEFASEITCDLLHIVFPRIICEEKYFYTVFLFL